MALDNGNATILKVHTLTSDIVVDELQMVLRNMKLGCLT
jgi:hypothetical protein